MLLIFVPLTLILCFSQILCDESLRMTYYKAGIPQKDPNRILYQFEDVYEYDELLCRKCGHYLSHNHVFVNQSTRHALQKYVVPICGIPALVQTLKNPNGEVFDVITTELAHVTTVGEPYSEASWFDHMTWTIAVCPKCGEHVGWFFDPLLPMRRYKFTAFILDKCVSAAFANELTHSTHT